MSFLRAIVGIAMALSGLGGSAMSAWWVCRSSYRMSRLEMIVDDPTRLLDVGVTTWLLLVVPILLTVGGVAVTLGGSPNQSRRATR